MNLATALAATANVLWDTAMLLVAGLTLAGIAAIWIGIFVGLHMWFKHWRLYSRHRLAVRIRRWLTARRKRAREARA